MFKITKRGEAMVGDVALIFRNFAGKAGKFNREGDRNFCAILSMEQAEVMEKDGWRIKWLQPREDGDAPKPYITVKVNYHSEWPPQIVMKTDHGQTTLDKDTVQILDYADIVYVDLVLNPYRFEPEAPITAYLSRAYITIEEDEFERKYSNVEDSARTSVEFEPIDD